MADRAGRVEAFRAHRYAVLDTVATKHAERIVEFGKTLRSCGVAAIDKEAIRLQQTSRANELVRVPPE